MQPIGIDSGFHKLMLEKKQMIFADEFCTETTCMRDYGKPVHKNTFRMMLDLNTNEMFCPKCKLHAASKNVSYVDTQVSEQWLDKEKKRYFKRYSMFAGKSFVDKGMKEFQAVTPKEVSAKDQVKQLINKLASGEIVNAVLSGGPGAGKSHLAYATAFNVNEMAADRKGQLACLFVDFNALISRVKGTYSDDATETREDILNVLKYADVLVIDDVGAETGRTSTKKEATDHTYTLLFDILNARDGLASTIITSNLSYPQLEKVYDDRIMSRLSFNLVKIDFGDITDKRKGLVL